MDKLPEIKLPSGPALIKLKLRALDSIKSHVSARLYNRIKRSIEKDEK